MTNQEYFTRFVEILNAHPESVRLLLKNYNVDAIGKPTIEDIKRANSTKLIEEIFLIEENKESANYAIGWLGIASTAANAVGSILGQISGTKSNSSNQETAAQIEARLKAEADAKAAEEKKKKQQMYIIIGVAVLVVGAVAFFLFNKNKNALTLNP